MEQTSPATIARSASDSRRLPIRRPSARREEAPARRREDSQTGHSERPPSGQPPSSSQGTHRSSKSRTSIPAKTGTWILGKTIGAGSMGKVKLAKRQEGGEQVAVKIVPRGIITDDNSNQSRADKERAERSKEIRTAREAAIVSLLDHPYICGMRDVVRTNAHWYMLFEYVNGGQMLDYIISHGRLREKQARKFSRQIASALDYCHRNSIVHRDLKIENILISKTGDIKIIDFGLSNLFDPKSLLSTYCGSLYFAAPELLQAKPYTGPEIDVWSFGIVLYVLVCGKVPFDDQSMPALHTKIKKGVVDYPSWVGSECKSLISRMLVTDPSQRATLQEIVHHPWMSRGFNGPPENYLPVREPISLPLDPQIVDAMVGFDFGSPEKITDQMTTILGSEDYKSAVRSTAKERETRQVRDSDKKRPFGFDFYKRRNSTNSKENLAVPSSEAIHLGTDPVNAFHPLISIYYLCQEKAQRDRQMENPGALGMPRAPGEAPLQLSEPAVPRPAHIRTTSIPEQRAVMPEAEPPNRTTELKKEPPVESLRKESATANLLRRFSTRAKKSNTNDQRAQEATRAMSEQPNFNRTPSSSRPARSDREYQSNGEGSRHRRGASSVRDRTPERDPPSSRGTMNRSVSVKQKPLVEKTRDPSASLNPRAATTMRARSLGHARRESIQARRARREEQREEHVDGVPEEVQNEEVEDNTGVTKPVYLKGLFSVSTTSSKPVPEIRRQIIKALNELGVKYSEIPGGFACQRLPSIDLDKVQDIPSSPPEKSRRVSFGGLNFGGRDELKKDATSPRHPRTPGRSNANANDTSFTNSESDERSNDSIDRAYRRGSRRVPAAGETSTHVQSDLGGSMILQFEIFIVKIPLLSMHGVQFKRVLGGTWQYKSMADQILKSLHL